MKFKTLAYGLIFAVIWSSAFTSSRVIVQYAPPLSALCLRFLISGALGVGIALALGQNWRCSRAQWRALILFGICQNGLYLGLNFVAMQTIEASLSAIIASAMPLIVAFASWSLLGERLPPLGIAGLLAGLLGVAIIMGSRLTGGVDLRGVLMCVLAVLSLSVATLTLRSASTGDNVLMTVGLQMLVGAAALAGPALLLEEHVITPAWQLGVAFTYTTLFPGLVATLVWFLLVREVGALRAAVFHFLTPFLGVAIAAVLLGERLGPLDLLGVVVIAAGIWAVQVARQTAQAE